MKKIILLFAIVLFGTTSHAKIVNLSLPQNLSKQSSISLLTCGSGNEYYLSFGHTAVRICDTAQGFDLVYNFGVFDFDTPNLYLKFAMGNLDYMIDVLSYKRFIRSYENEGRSIVEQKLNMNYEERNKLFYLVKELDTDENRYYKYDFFRNNCASRARDAINTCLDSSFIAPETDYSENMTYRELIYPYSNDKLLWWRLGCDILLGMRCDKPVPTAEYMFLPFEFQNQIDSSSLVTATTELLPDSRTPNSDSVSPIIVFWALFVLAVVFTFIEFRKKVSFRWFDVILFLLAGIIGLVIVFLWFVSSHWCTKVNLNILWLSPLLLLCIPYLGKASKYIIYIMMASLVLALINFVVRLQVYNAAALPIILTLVARLTACYGRIKRKTNQLG